MFMLARFFRKKERMEQFLSGKIHFSNIKEYRKVEAGLSLEDVMAGKGPNQAQMDIFEGTVAEINWDFINEQIDLNTKLSSELPIGLFHNAEMRDLIVANPRFLADGYNFANLLCMTKIDYTRPLINGVLGYNFALTDMSDFGSYVALVFNQKAFVDRLMHAAEDKSIHLLCGEVTYHPLVRGMQTVKELKSVTMISQESFDVSGFLESGYARYDACDTFDKWEKYRSQNEWRVTLDSRTDYKAETIDIGDISNLAKGCNVRNLEKTLQKIVNNRNISQTSGFIGNISREDMRNEFYRKGNGMAHVSYMIGDAKYE